MNKEKKGSQTERLLKILSVLFFAAFGFCSAYYQVKYFPGLGISFFLYPLLVLFISVPLHIFLHELGHLVTGFLSGYQFLLFRLGKKLWIKKAH